MADSSLPGNPENPVADKASRSPNRRDQPGRAGGLVEDVVDSPRDVLGLDDDPAVLDEELTPGTAGGLEDAEAAAEERDANSLYPPADPEARGTIRETLGNKGKGPSVSVDGEVAVGGPELLDVSLGTAAGIDESVGDVGVTAGTSAEGDVSILSTSTNGGLLDAEGQTSTDVGIDGPGVEADAGVSAGGTVGVFDEAVLRGSGRVAEHGEAEIGDVGGSSWASGGASGELLGDAVAGAGVSGASGVTGHVGDVNAGATGGAEAEFEVLGWDRAVGASAGAGGSAWIEGEEVGADAGAHADVTYGEMYFEEAGVPASPHCRRECRRGRRGRGAGSPGGCRHGDHGRRQGRRRQRRDRFAGRHRVAPRSRCRRQRGLDVNARWSDANDAWNEGADAAGDAWSDAEDAAGDAGDAVGGAAEDTGEAAEDLGESLGF